MKPTIASRLALLILSAALTGVTHGQIAPGVTLNFDANNPASGVDSTSWNSLTADATKDMTFGGDVTLESVTSSVAGITQAYRFAGGAGADQGNFETSYNEQDDTTWEFWVQPTDAGAAQQTIFEAGGTGDGMAIWFQPGTPGDDTGTINFTIDNVSTRVTVSAALDTTEFRHVVCVYDKDNASTDIMQIWIDGILAASDNSTDLLNDWAGSNQGGVGATQGGSIAETVTGGQFTGDISIFRFWQSRALTPAEVLANFKTPFVPGASFAVDAGLDTNGNTQWEDTVGSSGAEFFLDTTNGVARIPATTSKTILSHAYDFPGGFSGDTAPNDAEAGYGGAKLVTAGTTTECLSFRDLGFDNLDATLEFWIKPDTLTHGTTNGQIIWEDGGGTGYGLFINDNILYSDNDSGSDAQIAYDLTADTLGLLLDPATSEFMHVVLTRVASTGAEQLFINGTLVGSATDSGGNWSGGDGTGLGARGEANTGGQGNGDDGTESFDGQIAIFRVYSNEILSQPEIQDLYESQLPSEDLTPPTIVSSNPADNATGIYIGTDLILTFSEDVALTGNGSITLIEDPGGSATPVTLSSTTVSGTDLTLVPTASLTAGTDYAVQITADAIVDLSVDNGGGPNAFAGILDNTTWNFTTVAVDATAPVLTLQSPADEATNLPTTTSIVATFDESVLPDTGNITIVDVSSGTDTRVISVTDASQVSFAGSVMTVTPSSPLQLGKNYAVQIAATAVKNFNNLNYAGIADTTTWNFSIVSDLLLVHEPFDYAAGGLNGAGGTTEIGLTGTWTANSSSLVIDDSLFGVVDRAGGSIGNLGGGSNRFGGARTIDPAALAGNGLLADGGSLYFSIDLGYDTGGNLTNSRLVVVLGTESMNTGNFRYYYNTAGATGLGVTLGRFGGTNGKVVATQVRDSTFGSSGFGGNVFGSEVGAQFSGGQHGVIVGKLIWGATPGDDETLELYLADPADLTNEAAGTLISTLTVPGVDQTAYDTISWARGDKVVLDEIRYGTTWTAVTPLDATAPLLAAVSPQGTGTPPGGDDSLFRATFDEPVEAQASPTGSIVFRNAGDDTVFTTIAVTDGSQVSFNGKDLDITPTLLPVPGNSYYIEIESGALQDPAGNPFAGFTGSGTWDFTTDSTAPGVTITNNSVNSEVFFSVQQVIYTLSFDEVITTTAGVSDFETLGTATTTIDSVTQTNGTTVEVAVTATSTGTLTLNVKASASFLDGVGNSLDGPFADSATITARDVSVLNNQLGILSLTASNGTNPATGNLWQAGDTYRLVFLTSTETDATDTTLAYYDNFVQARAAAGSLGLGSATWQAVVSGESTDARDHTGTNPSTDGSSTAVFLVDGTTVVGSNYTNFWDPRPSGETFRAIDLDESGNTPGNSNGGNGWGQWGGTWTGTNSGGTINGTGVGGTGNVVVGLAKSGWTGNPSSSWINRGSGNAVSDTYYLYGISEVLTVSSTATSPYDLWVTANSVTGGPGDDDDLDTLDNLLEFGFGTDPNTGDNVPLVADGSVNGTPLSQSSGGGGGVTHDLLFVRRDDHGTAGSVTYTARFSGDLVTFFDSTVSPTFVADSTDDADYEVVKIPYPVLLPNGQKARFAQIVVEIVP